MEATYEQEASVNHFYDASILSFGAFVRHSCEGINTRTVFALLRPIHRSRLHGLMWPTQLITREVVSGVFKGVELIPDSSKDLIEHKQTNAIEETMLKESQKR